MLALLGKDHTMMKSKKKIALLGGDLRQYTAAQRLWNFGWELTIWGQDRSDWQSDGMTHCSDWEEAVRFAEAVILPLPASTDGIFLNCPFAAEENRIPLADLFSKAPSGCVIIGGRIPKELAAGAESLGLTVIDYFDSEPFQIHNAYTTAEAALSIAMNRLERNIRDSHIAITGFGRIAKHLVGILLPLGAHITVAARKPSDLAWAVSLGCEILRLGEDDARTMERLSRGYDVIYNTVPHWLFDREFLKKMDSSTFLIDLASVPGGVDICAAKELGANVLWATSLPGKYAPLSAGELIASCVHDILCEEVEP